MVSRDEQLEINPLEIFKGITVRINQEFFGLRVAVDVDDFDALAVKVRKALLVVRGQKLYERCPLRLRIAVGKLPLFGVDNILKAFVEGKSGNDHGFGGEAEEPKTGMAKAENEKARCGQRIERHAPQCRDLDANKKSRL
jgi:hypothetical protein